ncbi:DUF2076 domain-containing protein [Siccirubricoccus sp. KC 17139]|uniref:DUF2076 domain-containing protein n=1 Tax=Siccirubricoccus soli TaxID=2899147 RepID=A0ABT1DA12_9PROT|nr:DUF2076 family protein [Siccirubricoccus soli]MCO6418779.1 DUF2076 domain-containing protein [Siccirubricoccus soli]MCP2684914.1 DUF2076 domain-containing protein [Siccirubricoccus soli]
MNDEERRIITQFVERIAGVAPAASGSPRPWGGGSVPQSAPNLPPVDREADALIQDLFARYPEARYRITQTAFVQEAALVEAQNRIRQLEWEVENAKAQAQAAQQAPRSGGLFGGMFGGGSAPRQAAPTPPPPQPVYPPGYNPGMLQPQRSGSGFLGTALTTAAGVAGGMVLGNMLMNAFSGHGGAASAAGLGGADALGAATPTASPWSDPGAAAAAAGWGTDGGEKSAWGGDKDSGQPDATPTGYDGSPGDAGYDSGASYDSGSSYDDGGGDEEV